VFGLLQDRQGNERRPPGSHRMGESAIGMKRGSLGEGIGPRLGPFLLGRLGNHPRDSVVVFLVAGCADQECTALGPCVLPALEASVFRLAGLLSLGSFFGRGRLPMEAKLRAFSFAFGLGCCSRKRSKSSRVLVRGLVRPDSQLFRVERVRSKRCARKNATVLACERPLV